MTHNIAYVQSALQQLVGIRDALLTLGITGDSLFERIREDIARGLIHEARTHLNFVDVIVKANVPVRRDTPSPQVVGSSCCFCQRPGAVEIATTGTTMHQQGLRNAALGSLEASLLPNAELTGSKQPEKGQA